MADLDLSRVKRNVAKMAGMGAPMEDIDGYIASEGTTVDAVRAFKPGAASQSGQFGGAAMNATAGMNEAIYGTLGAPVDLMRGGMNLAVRGFNAVTGSEVPTIPENSFGGSRSIGEAMGGIRPELDPQNTVATDAGDRVARGVGQGVAGTVLPAAIVGGAARAGAIGPQVAEMGAQVFGRSNSVRSVGAEALTGAAAGAGSATAAEFTPEQYRSIGSFAGGLAGGGIGAALTGIPALVREGASVAGRYLEPFTQSGREQMAGRALRNGATDPQAAMEAIETAPRELVPGSQPTTFQLTGDMGLGAMERGSQARFPAEFGQRRADQNQARVTALEGIQPGGAPEKVAQSVRSFLQQIEDEAEATVGAATERARTGASGLGAGAQGDEAGAAMRANLESARAAAKARENALYAAVDPSGTMTLGLSNTRKSAQGIAEEMSPLAQPLSETERQIYGAIGQAGEAVPLRSMRDLQSNLKAAMRAERSTNGESPAYRRMSIVSAGIAKDFDDAVAGKVAQEAQAVARGEMDVSQTLFANMQRQQEAWFAGRQATARSADGGGHSVGYGSGGQAPVPGVLGTGGQTSGRPGAASSNQGLAGAEPGATFDGAAQERLRAANAATRERAETFDNPLLGPFRRKSATELPNATVARRIFSGSPESFEAVQTFRRAVGDAEASAALTPYAVGQARRAALNEDGTFDPAKLDRWRRQHADALRAMPELDARLGDVNRLSDTLAETVATERQRVETAQKSALGRFIGNENPDEVSNKIGGLLTRQDGARQLAEIRRAIGNDPEALEGLRKAAADFITGRLIGNAEVGTSGQAGIRVEQYQNFIRQNAEALRTIFSDAEILSMEGIAADMQRAGRSISAVKNPGTPGTAQDLMAAQGDDSPVSILAKIVGASATTGGSVTAVGGPVAGTIAGVGTLFGAALRENGIRRVEDLVKDALLNPDRAAALMSGVRSSKPEREAAIARRYRASVAASGWMALGEDEPPPNRAMELMRLAPAVGPLPAPAGRMPAPSPRASLDETPTEKVARVMLERGLDVTPSRAPSPSTQVVLQAMLAAKQRKAA